MRWALEAGFVINFTFDSPRSTLSIVFLCEFCFRLIFKAMNDVRTVVNLVSARRERGCSRQPLVCPKRRSEHRASDQGRIAWAYRIAHFIISPPPEQTLRFSRSCFSGGGV
jgi:hypothetical protein